ncbi:MAG: response regulator [Cellulophaga sp.]|uniref:response regulator n=1 Tax=unclassified Cellulophaga TaxID=2634405 RepID=UPI000C2C15A2|nr:MULTISPECIES: response regulator [unclassified Cellulophaga]MDO6491504.1 response regulator [Cellulophaga sp. 2_MG-2023]MDO6493381.1 response regulator [Cellulophaga sp. 3_MG-2023]PKB44630.1 DNA-binding NarL/FixJ family response regulator [Cellulophaga sp. RHA19]
MRTLKILAVDDHQLILKGYQYTFADINPAKYNINLTTAGSYQKAKQLIESNIFDVAFLDIQIERPDKDNIDGNKTGENLGILLRDISPKTKIIFQSSFSDSLRISNIFSSVNPDGYIVKTEVNEEVIEKALDNVLNDSTYYSKSAIDVFRKTMTNNIMINEDDKEILYRLSLGIKTKDLVDYVNLSVTGIETRKRKLKFIFDIENENDLALINEAKRRGFI